MEAIFGAASARAAEGMPRVDAINAIMPHGPKRRRSTAPLRYAAIGGTLVAGVAALAIGLTHHAGAGRPSAATTPAPVTPTRVAPRPPLPASSPPEPVEAARSAPAAIPATPAEAGPRLKRTADVRSPRRTAPPPRTVCEDRDRARCLRPGLLAADRQLRTAYETAVRAGVARRTLVASWRRWTALRRNANADPAGVADGYRALARQLDADRARHPDHG